MGCLAWPSTQIEEYRTPLHVPQRTRRRRYPRLWPEPRMAIAHVRTDTTLDVAIPGATTTLVKPTGIASGEIMIAAFVVSDTSITPATYTMPSGWVEGGTAGGFVKDDGFSGIRLQVFAAKDNVSSMVATKGGSGLAAGLGVVVAAFSGTNTTVFFDVVGAGDGITSATALTVSAITIATNSSWDCMVAGNGNSTSDTYTCTSFTVSQNAGTNAQCTGLLYNTTPKSAVSTGTATLNCSVTAGILGALRFAIKPAASANTLMGQAWM